MLSGRIGCWALLTVCCASTLAPAACLVNDPDFASTGGGCKDLDTGLVWSPDLRAFGPAPGGSPYLVPQPQIQTACNNRLNNSPNGGGYTDWRAPTLGEVQEALANGLNSHLNFFLNGSPDDGLYRWTRCSAGKKRGAQYSYTIRYSDGDVQPKAFDALPLICVRGLPPDSANDCPGHGKKNSRSVPKNELSQTSTGALLLLPLGLVVAARCLRPRRSELHSCLGW
jgi:hypothetical protein